MNVILYVNLGEHPVVIVSTTLGQFIADNIDCMDGSEIRDIGETLSRGGIYFGGGGASPEWSLKRAD